MREPLKFVALNALAASFAFGLGIDRLWRNRDKNEAVPKRGALVLPAVIAVVIPVSMSPGIFWGYGNHLQATNYPSTWDQANAEMTGDGAALALPWHQYLTFPFINEHHIVVNPSSIVFDRHVYEGNNVELPGLATTWTTTTSEYLDFLYGNGTNISTFGSLVAPLDVHYIVLEKTVDWKKYGWLDNQRDLHRVSDNDDLTVYENTKWTGTPYGVRKSVTVADWGELAAYSDAVGDVRGVFTTHNSAGALRTTSTTDIPELTAVTVKKNSATSYSVRSSTTSDTAVLTEPYVPGWHAQHADVIEAPQGTIAVKMERASTSLRYKPWTRYVVAYVISIGASITVVALTIVAKRRRLAIPPAA